VSAAAIDAGLDLVAILRLTLTQRRRPRAYGQFEWGLYFIALKECMPIIGGPTEKSDVGIKRASVVNKTGVRLHGVHLARL
jgi:hypothetical protein